MPHLHSATLTVTLTLTLTLSLLLTLTLILRYTLSLFYDEPAELSTDSTVSSMDLAPNSVSIEPNPNPNPNPKQIVLTLTLTLTLAPNSASIEPTRNHIAKPGPKYEVVFINERESKPDEQVSLFWVPQRAMLVTGRVM